MNQGGLTVEFIIWFAFVLIAIALAGEHVFPVIFLACLAQFVFSLVSVFASARRHAGIWRQ